MKEEYNSSAIQRCMLLQAGLDLGIKNSEMLKLLEPMRGKSDEEKEIIAAELLKKLKAKE